MFPHTATPTSFRRFAIIPKTLLLLGCNQIRNTILDPCRYSETGETGNCPILCDASLFDYGKDAKVGRRCQNVGAFSRRAIRTKRPYGPIRK